MLAHKSAIWQENSAEAPYFLGCLWNSYSEDGKHITPCYLSFNAPQQLMLFLQTILRSAPFLANQNVIGRGCQIMHNLALTSDLNQGYVFEIKDLNYNLEDFLLLIV